MSTQGGGPSAGWYADPENSQRERWWDGEEWSAKVRPVTTADSVASSPVGVVQTTSGLAIASLVLGIIGLCGVGAIVAIILGVVALSQIKKSGGRVGGRGMAIAGIATGSLWIVVGIGAAVVLMVAGDSLEDIGTDAICRTDTRTLRVAEEAYYADSEFGTYGSESDLVSEDYLSEESELHDILADEDAYEIIVADEQCGVVGNSVGDTSDDL